MPSFEDKILIIKTCQNVEDFLPEDCFIISQQELKETNTAPLCIKVANNHFN